MIRSLSIGLLFVVSLYGVIATLPLMLADKDEWVYTLAVAGIASVIVERLLRPRPTIGDRPEGDFRFPTELGDRFKLAPPTVVWFSPEMPFDDDPYDRED